MNLVILFLFATLLYLWFNKIEHLTDSPSEAVQNIASMFNNGNVITNKVQLGSKFSFSGIGDNVGGQVNNDEWLRLTDKDGTKYSGGIASGKLYVDTDATIKNNIVTKTINGATINSTGNKITLGNSDASNDVFVPRKTYLINANFGNGDVYSISKSVMSSDDAIKYCNSRLDCTRITENNDTFWFKNCNDGNWMVAGKDWPDEMVSCGGATEIGGDVQAGISSLNMKDCKTKCQNTPGCDFAQYYIPNKTCWLRKNHPVWKTSFLNKTM